MDNETYLFIVTGCSLLFFILNILQSWQLKQAWKIIQYQAETTRLVAEDYVDGDDNSDVRKGSS